MRPRLGTRGLPPQVHASWRRSLADRHEVPVRILAWARADEGYVVGSPALLSIGDGADPAGAVAEGAGSGEREAAGEVRGVGEDAVPASVAVPTQWRHVGWHEIELGGWNAESRSLSWTLYGGRRGRIGLTEPARLPELFRERVAASIVVERFVPIRGERGVTVTARRDLGGSGAITWHSTLTRGLTWSTEGVAERAAQASAELQSEYGEGSPGW